MTTSQISVFRTLILSLLACCSGLSAAPQVSEADAIKAFKKAVRQDPRSGRTARERAGAVRHLAGQDSKKIAQVLVRSIEAVQKEIDTAEQVYAEADRELYGKQTAGRKTKEQYQAQRNAVRAARKQIDALRSLRVTMDTRIGELRSAGAIRWLLGAVSGSRRYPLMLKVRIGEAAGAAGVPVQEALTKALRRSKVAEEISVLVRAVGFQGEEMRAASPVLIELLAHKSSLVRESAALALARLCDPLAIEPMIQLLARSYGQSKKRIGSALEILTRQEHGNSEGTWRRWWAVEKDKYLSGSAELGGGQPSTAKKSNQKNYYFGIPQDGKSIIYIIDRSGSMKTKVDFRLPKPGKGRTVARQVDGQSEKKATRLKACQDELIRALGRLEAGTRFNVVAFDYEIKVFQDAMEKAEPGRIKEAQNWVRKLTPRGSTNIHDSLKKAFEFAKGGAVKRRGPTTGRKKKESTPDTIFLLSDGSPTLPPGDKPDSTEAILKSVRDWNPLKAVIVHCIGIGRGVNAGFMKQLAQENGGEFKRY